MKETKRLHTVNSGQTVKIVNTHTMGKLKQKLLDMGFIPGSHITVIREAPLFDPMELSIFDYNISLRKSEAMLIEVEKL